MKPTNPLRPTFRMASLRIGGLLLATFASLPLVRAADIPEPVQQAEQQRIAAIAKATRSAISVFANQGQGGGSGVVITQDGYALSNFHVTKPAGDYMQCSMSDGRLYDAVIVGLDPTGDVALIKMLGREDFPAATLADSDEVQVGDWCFAIGNPFLLATDFQPTVTYGLVSGVHRYQEPAGTLLEYADCIQTDASINPGNSGGPLFNADGDLIGINGRGSFEKRGRVNVGVGYAISINQIKKFLGYLRSGRIVYHATLGATVASDEDGHVIVTNILETCDAYRRGLRYSDEIVAFGGRDVTTVNGFKNVLGIFPKGWRVPLTFIRDGERRDVDVRLMGVHRREELLEKTLGAPVPEDEPAPQPEGGDPKKRPNLPPGEPKPKQIPLPKKGPLPKGHPKQQAPPDDVRPLIVKRTGYANYYFNQLNRDRVWKGMAADGDFTATGAIWKLSGTLTEGGQVEIVLGKDQLIGRFPSEALEVDTSKDLDRQLGPRGSGGMLVALHLWQRLLRLGPDKFGEVYYLGTAPLVSRDGLYDVLVATHDVVESRFVCDADSGRLIALEMFPDPDLDPCEIYFDDYRDVDGRQIPHLLRVQSGADVWGVIRLEKIEFSDTPAKPATS